MASYAGARQLDRTPRSLAVVSLPALGWNSNFVKLEGYQKPPAFGGRGFNTGNQRQVSRFCAIKSQISGLLLYFTLVPAYFMMTRMTLKPVYLFFILCILSAAEERPLPWLNQHGRAFWRYYPLVLAVLVWFVYVLELPRRRTSFGSKSQF